MLKVIQNLKNSNSSHFSQHFNSLLHRGQKSKDPYNNRRLFNPARLLLKTLGTGRIFSPRCSRTFNSDSKFNNYINNSKNLRIAGFSSAFILLILSALSVYPIVRSLNSAEAVTPTNSTTSLSITSTNSAPVELLVKSDSGTFATSVGSQELSFGVTTNNYAGYNLTLYGKDETYNELKNSSTNTSLTSISGSKESSEFSNGSWGYTLDGGNTYLSAPDNETGYKIDTTSTPNKDTAKTYTLGIGARANYSTKAGTYANTYLLIPLANATPYTIYYKDNTNDSSVANLPTTQDEATSAININLSDTIPTRTGYTFSKWCDGTVSNDGTSCSGTLYGASASFGIDRIAASNVTTLYAVWTVNSYTLNITNNNTTSNPASSTAINFGGETTITVTPNAGYYLSEVSCPTGYTCSGYTTGSDATGAQTVTVKNNGDSTSATGGTIEFTAVSAVDGYLQDFTAAECSAMTTGSTKKLGDTRDGQAYQVAKLADGNCWMDNLNLIAPNADLTSSNTNLSTTVTKDTFAGWKKTSGSQTYDAGEFIPVSGTDSTSGTAYGTLYNYYAASAGTIKGSSNSNNATYDICPKGWRLPTGGSSGEFQTLYNSGYNSYAKMRNPISTGGAAFSIAGSFTSGAPTSQGGDGNYWSSTRNSDTTMSVLYLDTSNVYPSNSLNRRYGVSVRCIKKSAAEEIEYLQDMTPAVADTLATGTTLTLKDKRDEESYLVGKLADGNLWLLDNLRLDISDSTVKTKLTSSTTNATDTILGYLKNGGGSSPYPSSGVVAKTSSGGSWTNSYNLPYIATGYKDTTTTSYGSGSGKIGVYYNYCAASAGSYCYASNASSGDAQYDICPKGWRMPTGGSSGEYQGLANVYTNTTATNTSSLQYNLSTPLSGSFYGNSASSQGSLGYFWSSTRSSSSNMYLLYISSSNMSPQSSYDRYYGFSVRCVLNDNRTIADATYMQDVTAEMVAATADGKTATLTDIRDGNTYKVTKINGNLWMTQNLRYKGDTVGSSSTTTTWYLKSATTNVTTDKTMTMTDLTSGNTYDSARFHDSGSTSTGLWYNYAAASAMTITGSSNSTNAAYDICPKGWRLPTNSEQSGITSYASTFSPVTGGYYSSGSVGDTGGGYWWSATASNTASRYYLRYNGSSLGIVSYNRYSGFYVRCIRSAS